MIFTGQKPIWLIESDFDGLIDRIAQKNVAFSDRFFNGYVLNDLTYTTTFNFDTFRYNIGSVMVRRNNVDRFQDKEVKRRLDGGVCTVRLWTEGTAWADTEIIFKGLFEKDYHDKNVYVFRINDFSKNQKKSLVPKITINDDTWPLHRKAGGAGSVSGNPVPIVFGDFPNGVKCQCVDYSSDFLYIVTHGISKSVDADYTATTENVYDNDGFVINAGNYALETGVDSQGNPCTWIDFIGSYASEEPISCSIQGLTDGSGEYTGTAGTLLEHPSDILSYLFDNFGEVGAYADTETLKSLKVVFPSVKMATAITEQTDLDSITQRILSQLQCAVLPRIGGYNGVMIFDTEAGPVGNLIKDHVQLGKSAKFTKTPERLLCNKLEVQYHLNHSTGKYEKSIFRNKENNPDCLQSYIQYDNEYEKLITLDDIYETQTAELIANRYIDIFAFRHDILEWSVTYQDGFGYQEGDVLRITHDDSPGGWTEEFCILIEKSYQKDHIKQTLWRIAGE